jgi:hypothetical protein
MFINPSFAQGARCASANTATVPLHSSQRRHTSGLDVAKPSQCDHTVFGMVLTRAARRRNAFVTVPGTS